MRSLQKPSQPAWAVNQLARRLPDEVAELLQAGERLRRAQADALGSAGGAAAVREATAAERVAVKRLTEAADELLAEDGKRPTRSLLERVATTLRAAAVDEEARPLLEAGRLVSEVEPSGFGALAGMTPAGATVPARREQRREERKPAKRAAETTPRREPRATTRRAEEAAARRLEAERRRTLQARVRDLRAELREREREARALEREAERAEQAAADARSAADDAAAAAAEAAERLAEAEREL